MMEPDEIYDEIASLPPEAQQQVANFISFLKKQYKKTQKMALLNDVINDPFIGIWKDRKDMKDSSKWLRNIRKSEWSETD